MDGNKFAQNSTGLQAAIDEVEAANGGMVFLPCGTYSITSALTATMPSNNLGFKMVGAGLCTILQPDAGMTVLTVDMGSSNYQSLYLADFGFDLNDTDSTTIALAPGGQKAVVERIFADNNSSSASKAIITSNSSSHSIAFRDIRIRCDASSTSNGIHPDGNIITIDGADITGCEAAVYVNATLTNLTIKNSRLDEGVNALKVDGVGAVSINYLHNRAENNSASHLDIAGFDASTNRVFGLTVRDSYFTGMDLAAQDGITLFRANGVVIERNHFKGTGSVAKAVIFTASTTDVSLKGNTVNAVLATMTGFTGVPLPVSDVTITQTSSAGGFGAGLTVEGAVTFNDLGADVDFRVEGDNDANLLFLDAGLDLAIIAAKEDSLSAVPRWIFKQVDFGDMTAGATADTFTLWTLPANTMIHDVVGTVVTGWSGGSISAAVCSVGTNGGAANDLTLDDDFFAAATVYELHDATASGGKGALLYDATDKFAPYMAVAAATIEIQCDLTGDNHVNATAGQARIYILVSQPLGNTTAEAN